MKASKRDIKMTVLVDSKPEICKDYKLAGVCPFGDTCIFIHDRGDYKLGHEL